jgi:LCP family protein required for cell wall assembly
MDHFKYPSREGGRKGNSRAVDGFFTPTTNTNMSQTRKAAGFSQAVPARRRMTRVSSLPSQGRPLDGFKRPNGLYPVNNGQLRQPFQKAAPKVTPGIASRSLPPINMALPDGASAQRGQAAPVKQRRFRFSIFKRRKAVHGWRRGVRIAARTTFATVFIALALGGFLFTKGYIKLHKVFQGGASAAALQTNVNPSLLKGEGDGRINVLLMGIGGQGHDGADLTDTLMVASIDPINNRATLVSVPRDLWVKMPNNFISNYQKINAAYESGKYKYLGVQTASSSNKQAVQAGFAAADSTMEQVLGIPIHYNLLVNFQAFRQAVDTVGGVTVNVPEQLYDPTMAYNPVLAKAGVQQFDGKHALIYVRSRETSSDFARNARQRTVMTALKDKVFAADTLSNPLKISNLISAFGDNVQSDVSLSDMSRLASIMKKVSNGNITSLGLGDAANKLITTGNMNGISIDEPIAGLSDFSAIQAFVRGSLKDGYLLKENANVTVLNGTVTPGVAATAATTLKSYGYNVGTVGDAATTDYATTKIIDLTHGTDKYTLHYLKQRYSGATVTTTVPAGIVPGTANIIVILGLDEATTN